MSYSKLIHEYLDSQLNAVNEDVLFAELAKNPDLRVDFNQQVQLQNVAMSDMRTITPPTESTNAIFTSLGFTIPSGDYLRRIAPNPGSSIALRPVGNTVTRLFKKHVATVAAVIITASLTTAVFMLTDNRFASQSADENIGKVNVQRNIPVVSSQEKNDIATVKLSNLTNTTRTHSNTVANIDEKATQPVVEENSINMASLFNNAPSVRTNSSNETINLMGANHNNPSGYVNNDVYDPFLSALKIEPVQHFNDGNFAVIVSYSDQASNISVTAPGQNFALNNINFTTLYKINDNWYVGASFGAEQFALNFSTDEHQYEKLPSLKYFGLGGKFALPLKDYFEYGEFLTPYIQAFGGSTLSGWFLGRGQVGLTVAGYNKIAFNVGYEVSTFVYKVDDLKSSFKNGLVFGAGYSF